MIQRWVAAVNTVLVFSAFLVFVCESNIAHGTTRKAINSFAGKYIAYADRFYMCEEGDSLDWRWNLRHSHWNPAKPNELQRLTGWLNGSINHVTDSSWAQVNLDRRSNNMWKDNALIFKFPAGSCTALRKNIPGFYSTVFKLPKDGPCDIPPGNYEVKNESVNWAFPAVPILQ
ncbi:uncharacterized protein LOC117643354 [Thrips palmi]|nr:uncharacterized protein LOC117643354 [Thrips palmi]